MPEKKPVKVAVIGFDCAEPHLIEKHIQEGHLPNFKKLIEGGVIADNCLAPYPTITPPNWATIATGAWAGTHGITDFHLPQAGATPDNSSTRAAFSSAHCQAEYVWDALDREGKKSIVVNYPGSWPSKMKHGIIAGGAGLTIGEWRDGLPGLASKDILCSDELVTTGSYPLAIRGKWQPAAGWQNLTDPGEEPLEIAFDLSFRLAMENPAPATWYLLARQSQNNGYDSITLSPNRNFKDAFFTIKPGEWAKKVFTTIRMSDSSEREVFFRAKLLELSRDAEEFRLYVTSLCQTTSWFHPESAIKVKDINSPEGVFGPTGGAIGYSMGWYGLDTFAEISHLHDVWLGDLVCHLLTKNPWDLFYMHSHPPDWMYHVVMTDMDPHTCKDKEAYGNAWETHLKIYQSQDEFLGRVVKAARNDTLFMLVSDHGAVPDGPSFNPYRALIDAGLSVISEGKEDTRRSFLGADLDISDQRVHTLKMALSRGKMPDPKRCKAFAQRSCHIFINLKGRDPEGIVEPSDYEKVQQEIIDAMLKYVDPATKKRPVALALSRNDARILGLYGEMVGDVVYAIYPQFGSQHGQQLPTAEWGVGSLKALLVINGPGIKRGERLKRTCWLTDIVPTLCYMTGFQVPDQAEGCVLYQALTEVAPALAENKKTANITRAKPGIKTAVTKRTSKKVSTTKSESVKTANATARKKTK